MLSLAACQQEPENQSRAAQAPVAAAGQDPIILMPASLSSCDVGAVVVVTWDIRTKHPDVTETEVWTNVGTGDLTLFAASGPSGEATTGPWAGPGSVFAIKNRTTGEELARAAVQGPDCN